MIHHTHADEHGLLVKCYHKCRTTFLDVSFWLGITLSYPLEHFLWEKVPVFRDITQWLGL